jgi:hypothetical protein
MAISLKRTQIVKCPMKGSAHLEVFYERQRNQISISVRGTQIDECALRESAN